MEKHTVNIKKVIENFEIFSTWVLFQLGKKNLSKRNIYFRNTLAKSTSLLKSIFILYNKDLYNDGFILYRALVDRLVYVLYIIDKDNYEDFDDWSFLKIFEYINSARSDNLFKEVLTNPAFSATKEQLIRYNSIKERKLNWDKPRAEDVFKSKKLKFLYNFGYKVGSMYTHPMSNDGQYEFVLLTGVKTKQYDSYPSRELLNNSILVNSIIHQEIFNSMEYKFSKLVYTFIEDANKYLNNETNEMELVFYKLLKQAEIEQDWME